MVTTTSLIVAPVILPIRLTRINGSAEIAARRARLGLTENGVFGAINGVGISALYTLAAWKSNFVVSLVSDGIDFI